jgi:hypothetical protein
VALTLSGLAAAQQPAAPALRGNVTDAVGLPGQSWTVIGNLSPIEHNDGYVQTYVEQGAAVLANGSGSLTVTPYVSLSLIVDTKGFNWNNKVEPRAGVKVNKWFRNGVVSLGSAYSHEKRLNEISSGGFIVYAQDWFGWQSLSDGKSRFPGSTWAAVGNISPVERGNIIGQGYFSQGVVAKRLRGITLVPYAETTFSRDSEGFDWDNKAIYGAGVKAAIPRGALYTELGASLLRENRFISGRSATGLTVFMNFSFGWNLLGRKVGR